MKTKMTLLAGLLLTIAGSALGAEWSQLTHGTPVVTTRDFRVWQDTKGSWIPRLTTIPKGTELRVVDHSVGSDAISTYDVILMSDGDFYTPEVYRKDSKRYYFTHFDFRWLKAQDFPELQIRY